MSAQVYKDDIVSCLRGKRVSDVGGLRAGERVTCFSSGLLITG